jgi:hypothetical protein
MRFTSRLLIVTLALALFVGAPAYAQTALTQTYLSTATTASSTTVKVAAATSIVKGWYLYIDKEALLVQETPTTTFVQVQRGAGGTAPAAHAASAGVIAQSPIAFYETDVSGACTTTTETYLPHINLRTGNIFDCLTVANTSASGAGVWVQYRQNGLPAHNSVGIGYTALTASAAVLVKPGIVGLAGGSAQSYTLAAPAYAQDGIVMTFTVNSAQAHTLDVTGGLNGVVGQHVATFSAVGDTLVCIAYHGVWYLVSFRGTSIGT